jgi:hypothetical protein
MEVFSCHRDHTLLPTTASVPSVAMPQTLATIRHLLHPFFVRRSAGKAQPGELQGRKERKERKERVERTIMMSFFSGGTVG